MWIFSRGRDQGEHIDLWNGSRLTGIHVVQNGCFRHVNQGFADIFGYATPDELIDKVMISQLIAPEEQKVIPPA